VGAAALIFLSHPSKPAKILIKGSPGKTIMVTFFRPPSSAKSVKKIAPKTPPLKSSSAGRVLIPKRSDPPEKLNKTSGGSGRVVIKAPTTVGNGVHPTYPLMSRRMGEEGSVSLKITVLPNGQPEKVVIVKSSGYDRLDDSARHAAESADYVPETLAGVSRKSDLLLDVLFRLR